MGAGGVAFGGGGAGPVGGIDLGAGAEEEAEDAAVDLVFGVALGFVAGGGELLILRGGEDHERVEFGATLVVGLAAGACAAAEEFALSQGDGAEEVHVGFEDFGAGGGVGGAGLGLAVFGLEVFDGLLGLGGVLAVGVAWGEAEGAEHELDVIEFPVVGGALGVGVEGFPEGGIAGEDAVDGLGAAAGEFLVIGVVANGIGVTEEGEGGAGDGGADGGEFGEFDFGGGEDEGGIEVEADVVELPAGYRDELLTDGIFFFAVRGGGEDRERILIFVRCRISAVEFFITVGHVTDRLRDELQYIRSLRGPVLGVFRGLRGRLEVVPRGYQGWGRPGVSSVTFAAVRAANSAGVPVSGGKVP